MSQNLKKQSSNALTLAALGIVFGDIGTSPLYAVREAFHGPHALATTHENVLGILSLIVWSLLIVISVKYLVFVLSADNKGEGGVMALTSLAAPKSVQVSRWSMLALYLGLFGSALLFGDGVITPAISVLSAVEGLKVATPFFDPFVLPITLVILFGLFYSQKLGTARIGSVFGPVLLIWFSTLAALGIYGSLQNPIVYTAFDPRHAIHFFIHNGWTGVLALGAVFLVVTGGEAMYADMGHFGKTPIRRAWFFVALPGLLLNYFGQGAILLSNPAAAVNPFYNLAPSWALYPLVILATISAVIASQALISGVFSLTRQAVLLGYTPRMQIIHTSSSEIGQIYIPLINWTLFLLTSWLVISFKSSGELASAYGIAVAMTASATTILTCVVASRIWGWNPFAVALVVLFFVSIDFVFLTANLTKVLQGGWFPLLMGTIVFTLMTTWKKGRQILQARLRQQQSPLQQFFAEVDVKKPARIPGAAVFMTGDATGTPLALIKNVKHNKCLHSQNLLLTIISKEVPQVSNSERLQIEALPHGFYRIIAKYGFMEKPNIQDIIELCSKSGIGINLSEVTFFLGRETLLASKFPGMALWREHLFSIMSKNAERATAFYGIPADQVIEVGIQVEI